RLIGESLNERDLLVVERLGTVAHGADRANDLVVPDHGSVDHGIEPQLPRELLGCRRRGGVSPHRRGMEDLLREHCKTTARAPIQRTRELLIECLKFQLVSYGS